MITAILFAATYNYCFSSRILVLDPHIFFDQHFGKQSTVERIVNLSIEQGRNAMNAHKIKTELVKDGTLLLEGLPFSSGQWVEVIVLDAEEPVTLQSASNFKHSGTTSQDADYFAAVSATMTEWQSKADEIAYRDL